RRPPTSPLSPYTTLFRSAAQNPRGMFVTMACLDVRKGRVTGANAGHDTTLLVGASGSPRKVFPSSGVMLGLFPGQRYADETLDRSEEHTSELQSLTNIVC